MIKEKKKLKLQAHSPLQEIKKYLCQMRFQESNFLSYYSQSASNIQRLKLDFNIDTKLQFGLVEFASRPKRN